MAEYGRIWQNMAQYGKLWQNITKVGNKPPPPLDQSWPIWTLFRPAGHPKQGGGGFYYATASPAEPGSAGAHIVSSGPLQSLHFRQVL